MNHLISCITLDKMWILSTQIVPITLSIWRVHMQKQILCHFQKKRKSGATNIQGGPERMQHLHVWSLISKKSGTRSH